MACQIRLVALKGEYFHRLFPRQIEFFVPFDLPPAFVKNAKRINGAATYDFVTTNDIIGGNSGSPVIDRSGAVIGAAFDGNINSLGGNYGYDGTINRTVAVSTDAIQEALEKVYPAPALVAELKGR